MNEPLLGSGPQRAGRAPGVCAHSASLSHSGKLQVALLSEPKHAKCTPSTSAVQVPVVVPFVHVQLWLG